MKLDIQRDQYTVNLVLSDDEMSTLRSALVVALETVSTVFASDLLNTLIAQIDKAQEYP